MADRTKVVKVVGSLVALTFSGLVLFTMYGPEGCGPSEDEVKVVAQLNNLEEMIQKGGYVKKITPIEERDDRGDSVYGFEAEIEDEKGVAIGRLRSFRVEGFGMMKPRYLWYKQPGVPEDWPPRGERRRRGDGERRDGERREGAPPNAQQSAPPAQ